MNIPQPSEDRGNAGTDRESAGDKEFHFDPPAPAAGVLPWAAYEIVSAVLQRRRADYRAKMDSLPEGDSERFRLLDLACEMSEIRLELLDLTFPDFGSASGPSTAPAGDEGDSSP